MATKPQTPPQQPEGPQPQPGCVFMTRPNADTGENDQAEVDVASGSVEIMAALGWVQVEA